MRGGGDDGGDADDEDDDGGHGPVTVEDKGPASLTFTTGEFAASEGGIAVKGGKEGETALLMLLLVFIVAPFGVPAACGMLCWKEVSDTDVAPGFSNTFSAAGLLVGGHHAAPPCSAATTTAAASLGRVFVRLLNERSVVVAAVPAV